MARIAHPLSTITPDSGQPGTGLVNPEGGSGATRDGMNNTEGSHGGAAPDAAAAGLAAGGTTRPTEQHSPTHDAPSFPSPYRGKSSGEFKRAVPSAPDINELVARAERHAASLPLTNHNRRLLEIAILRRDTALISGLLESLGEKML